MFNAPIYFEPSNSLFWSLCLSRCDIHTGFRRALLVLQFDLPSGSESLLPGHSECTNNSSSCRLWNGNCLHQRCGFSSDLVVTASTCKAAGSCTQSPNPAALAGELPYVLLTDAL